MSLSSDDTTTPTRPPILSSSSDWDYWFAIRRANAIDVWKYVDRKGTEDLGPAPVKPEKPPQGSPISVLERVRWDYEDYAFESEQYLKLREEIGAVYIDILTSIHPDHLYKIAEVFSAREAFKILEAALAPTDFERRLLREERAKLNKLTRGRG